MHEVAEAITGEAVPFFTRFGTLDTYTVATETYATTVNARYATSTSGSAAPGFFKVTWRAPWPPPRLPSGRRGSTSTRNGPNSSDSGSDAPQTWPAAISTPPSRLSARTQNGRVPSCTFRPASGPAARPRSTATHAAHRGARAADAGSLRDPRSRFAFGYAGRGLRPAAAPAPAPSRAAARPVSRVDRSLQRRRSGSGMASNRRPPAIDPGRAEQAASWPSSGRACLTAGTPPAPRGWVDGRRDGERQGKLDGVLANVDKRCPRRCAR
jgi:hypothetical protein